MQRYQLDRIISLIMLLIAGLSFYVRPTQAGWWFLCPSFYLQNFSHSGTKDPGGHKPGKYLFAGSCGAQRFHRTMTIEADYSNHIAKEIIKYKDKSSWGGVKYESGKLELQYQCNSDPWRSDSPCTLFHSSFSTTATGLGAKFPGGLPSSPRPLSRNIAKAEIAEYCSSKKKAQILIPKEYSNHHVESGKAILFAVKAPDPCNNMGAKVVVNLEIRNVLGSGFNGTVYQLTMSNNISMKKILLPPGKWDARVRVVKPEPGKWSTWRTFAISDTSGFVTIKSPNQKGLVTGSSLLLQAAASMPDHSLLSAVQDIKLSWEHQSDNTNFTPWTQYWPGTLPAKLKLPTMPPNPVNPSKGYYARQAEVSIPVSKLYTGKSRVKACIQDPKTPAALLCSQWTVFWTTQAQQLPPVKPKITLQGKKNLPGQRQATIHFGSKVPAGDKVKNRFQLLRKPLPDQARGKLSQNLSARSTNTSISKLKPLSTRTPRPTLPRLIRSNIFKQIQPVTREAPVGTITKQAATALPDLFPAVRKVIINPQCKAAQAVRVQLWIKNKGKGAFPTLSPSIKALSAVGGSGLASTGVPLPAIAAGAQVNRELTLASTVPMANLAGKNIAVTIQVNQHKWVSETTYSNNSRTVYARFPATYCASTVRRARSRQASQRQATRRSNTSRTNPGPPASPPVLLIVPTRRSP